MLKHTWFYFSFIYFRHFGNFVFKNFVRCQTYCEESWFFNIILSSKNNIYLSVFSLCGYWSSSSILSKSNMLGTLILQSHTVHIPFTPIQYSLVRHKDSLSLTVRLFDQTGVKLWPQEKQNYCLLQANVIAIPLSHDPFAGLHSFLFPLLPSPFDIFLEGN